MNSTSPVTMAQCQLEENLHLPTILLAGHTQIKCPPIPAKLTEIHSVEVSDTTTQLDKSQFFN